MIGPELSFESVNGMSKGCCHDTGIRNDHIKRLALSEQLIGAVADARETGQIELDEVEASTLRRRVLLYLSCRRFGLGRVARGANYVRAMGGE